jgi:6,7-dimethyl-8-ribityllumazine synthase
MIKTEMVDAVICIGVLVKGETMHFEYIAEAVTQGIMRLNLDNEIPVMFGVLCVFEWEQALMRTGLLKGGHNHGEDWGQGAVEMALLGKKY